MTNSVAFGLGVLILMAIGADLYFETGALVFLAKRFVELTEYLAFWR